MAKDYASMTYEQRLRIYEREKTYLSQVCTSWQEYDKEVKKLIEKLGI